MSAPRFITEEIRNSIYWSNGVSTRLGARYFVDDMNQPGEYKIQPVYEFNSESGRNNLRPMSRLFMERGLSNDAINKIGQLVFVVESESKRDSVWVFFGRDLIVAGFENSVIESVVNMNRNEVGVGAIGFISGVDWNNTVNIVKVYKTPRGLKKDVKRNESGSIIIDSHNGIEILPVELRVNAPKHYKKNRRSQF